MGRLYTTNLRKRSSIAEIRITTAKAGKLNSDAAE